VTSVLGCGWGAMGGQGPLVDWLRLVEAGLFVPKPTRDAGCQGCGLPGLGSTVRRCPLTSTAVGGDCYSLGYSVAREAVL
jgi:hypothetical protein